MTKYCHAESLRSPDSSPCAINKKKKKNKKKSKKIIRQRKNHDEWFVFFAAKQKRLFIDIRAEERPRSVTSCVPREMQNLVDDDPGDR